MATTIKLKNGSGAPLAADLVQGEVALDLTNKRIYTENASGTVIELGTSPSTIDINAGTIDGTVIGGASAAAGTFTTLTANGNVVLGDAATDTVTVTADVASDLIPSADGTYDLGASGSEWQDLFIDGTANIDSLVADTADINGGSIDGATLGTNSAITEAQIDNINIDGNTISSTDTNGNIALTPDGTGEVDISKVDIDSGTIDGTVIGGSTAAAGTFTTLSSTGNTTLGDASTDTVTVNGYMGVGNSGQANIGLYLRNSNLILGSQYGAFISPTASSAATSEIVGVYTAPATAASAFTVNNSVGVSVGNATLGAGSSITNQYGISVGDQTRGTNNYGITSLVSSGTNKWNIYASGTAANYFAGNVGIGTTSPSSFTGLAANNLVVGSGSANEGITIYSGNSTNNYGAIAFADGTSGTEQYRGYILYQHDVDALRFATSATERMRIDSSGHTLPGADNTQDLGSSTKRWNDLFLGGSVYLGGTTSANALDDYEEGTWTPTLTIGGSVIATGLSTSTYTKVGNTVYVNVNFNDFSWSKGANTGQVKISNLPFTGAPSGRNSGPSPILIGSVFDVNDANIITSNASGTDIDLNDGNQIGSSALTEANVSSSGSNAYLRLGFTYKTS